MMIQNNSNVEDKSTIDKLNEAHLKHRQSNLDEEYLKHWRSWGSWFSWGSPIGLGIWFLCLAATFWIVMQALH